MSCDDGPVLPVSRMPTRLMASTSAVTQARKLRISRRRSANDDRRQPFWAAWARATLCVIDRAVSAGTVARWAWVDGSKQVMKGVSTSAAAAAEVVVVVGGRSDRSVRWASSAGRSRILPRQLERASCQAGREGGQHLGMTRVGESKRERGGRGRGVARRRRRWRGRTDLGVDDVETDDGGGGLATSEEEGPAEQTEAADDEADERGRAEGGQDEDETGHPAVRCGKMAAAASRRVGLGLGRSGRVGRVVVVRRRPVASLSPFARPHRPTDRPCYAPSSRPGPASLATTTTTA